MITASGERVVDPAACEIRASGLGDAKRDALDALFLEPRQGCEGSCEYLFRVEFYTQTTDTLDEGISRHPGRIGAKAYRHRTPSQRGDRLCCARNQMVADENCSVQVQEHTLDVVELLRALGHLD